jgi:hypothetical protein
MIRTIQKDNVLIVINMVMALFVFLSPTTDASTAVKIVIEADGIYSLTYDDLQNAGFDLSTIDPATIKITNKGTEIPLYIYGGEDGIFDSSDYLLFYGIAISKGSPQFEFTVSNMYWLAAGGSAGLRMTAKEGTPSGNAPLYANFNATIHMEDDSYYWQSLPDGEGRDHWFWGNRIHAPSSNIYTFSLSNISSTASDAIVRVGLQGRSDTSGDPDHHTKIYLNNNLVDDQYWNGLVQYFHTAVVPHAYLLEGTNTIRLDSVNDTGAPADIIHMDWFEIDYIDTFVAENDFLDFTVTDIGNYEFEISGFTDSDVEIYDISDSYNVMRVVNNVTELNGSVYVTSFEDTIAQAPVRYGVLSALQRKTPASIILDSPSSLKSTSNGADLIIITYDTFFDNIMPLSEHYQNLGLRVMTARITDIYDEFSYGIFDPQAIKDFLHYAYHNWVSPAPLYVLLVGDANIDYKDNFGTGNINYIPTHLFETDLLGQTPGDNWFVSVSGADILPDMFIGRFSVQTTSEVDGVVNKVLSYASTQPLAWTTNIQFVADNGLQFESLSDSLAANYLPPDYTADKVYMSQYSSGSNANRDIKSNIGQGTLITNYTGHGSVYNWATENMLLKSDIATFNNFGKLAFITTLNCLNGFFPLPLSPGQPPEDQTSLAEELLVQPEVGAIAVFAPTGLGFTSEHNMLSEELFNSIFNEGNITLGSTVTEAKIRAFAMGASSDLVESFVLFGDPITELRVQTLNLDISKIGNGGGIVTSSIFGIDCGTDCSEDYISHVEVSLIATPDAGSLFTGFTGNPDCTDGTVTMDTDKNCTAFFNLQTHSLDVLKAGSGSGTVVSDIAGIDCGQDCSHLYDYGTEITLIPSPDADSRFAGFTGDPDCTDGIVIMGANTNCTATFNLSQYQLITSITPVNNGTIIPDCSGGCWYDSGEVIVLTAYVDSGYPFTGWTGCDSASDNTCIMTIDADKILSANFDSCRYPVRIEGATPAYYDSLQQAYEESENGGTIQSRSVNLTGDMIIDKGAFITLEGGYNCDYSENNGLTVLNGNMTINSGAADIKYFVLQ